MAKLGIPVIEVRNPLGIIALFISFIYAVSAAVLGIRADTLTDSNETLLVFFVIISPFVVLIIFTWLVIHHHEKLYSPQDYRSDEGFHFGRGDPKSLGRRLSEEVEITNRPENDPLPEAARETPESGTGPDSADPITRENSSLEANDMVAEPKEDTKKVNLIAQTYLIEGLVFQELQTEFNGLIQRNISISNKGIRREIDGIIKTPSGIVIVEVKFIRQARTILSVINQVERNFKEISSNFTDPSASYMAVLVSDEASIEGRIQSVISARSIFKQNPIEFRTYNYEYLASKYGVLN